VAEQRNQCRRIPGNALNAPDSDCSDNDSQQITGDGIDADDVKTPDRGHEWVEIFNLRLGVGVSVGTMLKLNISTHS